MKKFIYLLLFILDVVLTPIITVIVYLAVMLYMLYWAIRMKGDVKATYKDVTTNFNKFFVDNLINAFKVHKERILEV